MREFVPIEKSKEENNPPIEQADKPLISDVQKAKEAAEIQKYETERVESQRQAVFAENDIKDTDDLQVKITEVADKETQLAKDYMAFENKKATELSEIQKHKAELEQKTAELNKKAQDVAGREVNVELREQLVAEREELMNSVERQELQETEKHNSLVEQLKRGFSQISNLLGENANILIKAGFRKLGYGLWDEIEQMEDWNKNDIGGHCDTIVKWMKDEVDDCNKKAVLMARDPKQYGENTHNRIVDNLEEIYELLPVLKPSYLPEEEG